MDINQQPETYPESFRGLAHTVLVWEATRIKKIKNCTCADSIILWRHYIWWLVHGGLIVTLLKGAVVTPAILFFLSCHQHYKGITPFQKVVFEGNEP